MQWLKKYFWRISNALLIAILLANTGVQFANRGSDGVTFRLGYVGSSAYAAGTVDYPYDATNASAAFQAALNALPVTGGRLVDVSGVSKNFSATVARAIPNVVIEGAGFGSNFTHNNSMPLFTSDVNWIFTKLSTDAGGITLVPTTQLDKVMVGSVKYNTRTDGLSLLVAVNASTVNATQVTTTTLNATQANLTTANISILNAPTGRGATYVIAFADATATEKAQADLRLTGTGDTAAVQAYLNTANNTSIHFTSGSMNVSAHPTINEGGQIPGLFLGNQTGLFITGEGQNTKFLVTTNNSVWGVASCSNITFRDFMIAGNNNSAFSLQTGIGMFFGNDNIRILNLDILAVGYDGIYGLASCSNILVEGNRITNTGDDGINPGGGFASEVGSSHWLIKNNIISGCKNDGIHISNLSWGTIAEGNSVENCSGGVAFWNSSNNLVRGNYIKNVANGIYTVALSCNSEAIDGNYIWSATSNGIDLGHTSLNSSITNNYVKDAVTYGIYVHNGSDNSIINGNTVLGSTRGIFANILYSTITNNVLIGQSQYGLIVNNGGATLTANIISGNSVNASTSATGLFLAGSNCTVINNLMNGNFATGAFSITGNNNVVRSNIGYVTENSGNATMLLNTNTISVTHGLASTPTWVQFSSTSNETGWLRVVSVGATTFNISSSYNVTANTTIYWRVTVGAGN